MSNDCTYVNNLTNNKNFDIIDENSSEITYKKITDYQLKIKVEGNIYGGTLLFMENYEIKIF